MAARSVLLVALSAVCFQVECVSSQNPFEFAGLGCGFPFGFPPSCAQALPSFPMVGGTCGPSPKSLPVIQAPTLTAPCFEGPIIPLPSPPIPQPQTIAHKCFCTKTVVKPQIFQRLISVPSVRKIVKQSFTPVVENIAYTANPICSPGSAPVPVPVPSCAAPVPSPCACKPFGL